MMKAKEALSLGVVDRVFEPVDFLEKSFGFAARILSGSESITRQDFSKDDEGYKRAIQQGQAMMKKKYGGGDVAAPIKALELIKAAQHSTLSQGFDAEDET